jgi:hypothetical protein
MGIGDRPWLLSFKALAASARPRPLLKPASASVPARLNRSTGGSAAREDGDLNRLAVGDRLDGLDDRAEREAVGDHGDQGYADDAS